jgi:hypothetical protein
MSLRCAVLVLALLLAAGAAVAAPPLDLPECVRHAAFAGITSTDGSGNLLGAPDPTDWGCAAATALDVGPNPVPANFCADPAFPNPASGSTSLGFSLPRPASVSVVVYGQHGKRGKAFAVRTLVSGLMAAGTFRVTWDLKDDQGVPLAPDIYRAVIMAEGKELCGDIEVR